MTRRTVLIEATLPGEGGWMVVEEKQETMGVFLNQRPVLIQNLSMYLFVYLPEMADVFVTQRRDRQRHSSKKGSQLPSLGTQMTMTMSVVGLSWTSQSETIFSWLTSDILEIDLTTHSIAGKTASLNQDIAR